MTIKPDFCVVSNLSAIVTELWNENSSMHLIQISDREQNCGTSKNKKVKNSSGRSRTFQYVQCSCTVHYCDMP